MLTSALVPSARPCYYTTQPDMEAHAPTPRTRSPWIVASFCIAVLMCLFGALLGTQGPHSQQFVSPALASSRMQPPSPVRGNPRGWGTRLGSSDSTATTTAVFTEVTTRPLPDPNRKGFDMGEDGADVADKPPARKRPPTMSVTIGSMVMNRGATEEGENASEENNRIMTAIWYGPKDPRNMLEPLLDRAQTENRAQLRSALSVLRMFQKEKLLEIKCTSTYIPDVVYGGTLGRWRQKGWKGNIKNVHLWQQLDAALLKRNGKVVWKYASKAERKVMAQSMQDKATKLKSSTVVFISVLPSALITRPILYGAWFGQDDPRNVVTELLDGSQTENRAALRAAILALEAMATAPNRVIEIKTRSDYLIQSARRLTDWANTGWIGSDGRPVANRDLWKTVWSLLQTLDKEVIWTYLRLSSDIALQASLFSPALLPATMPSLPTTPASTTVVYTSVVWPHGQGSPAVYGIWFGKEDPRNTYSSAADSFESQNAVELQAVIAALQRLEELGASEVEVRTHSIYIVQNVQKLEEWAERGWIKKRGEPIANVELWQQLYRLYRQRAPNMNVNLRYVELRERKEATADLMEYTSTLPVPDTQTDRFLAQARQLEGSATEASTEEEQVPRKIAEISDALRELQEKEKELEDVKTRLQSLISEGRK